MWTVVGSNSGFVLTKLKVNLKKASSEKDLLLVMYTFETWHHGTDSPTGLHLIEHQHRLGLDNDAMAVSFPVSIKKYFECMIFIWLQRGK